MASWKGIKYKLHKSENFDEYMKELGVGLMLRKMGNTLSPIVELKKNNDGSYSLTTTTSFKTVTVNFKLGEEFEVETPDGRKVKCIFTMDGDKLVEEQKGDKPTKIVREFTPTELTTTLTIGNITCVRIYRAV